MTAEIRELLELAAQAAGSQVTGWVDDKLHLIDSEGHPVFGWNPRESGDDLIELVAGLGIDVLWHENNISAVIACENGSCVKTEYLSDHPTCKDALSMAVVRCAAEYQRRKG